jgi:hypothetical protein
MATIELLMDMMLSGAVGLVKVLILSYVAWFLTMNAWGSYRY